MLNTQYNVLGTTLQFQRMTCPKAFSPANSLKTHEVAHNGIRDFKCINFPKIFSHKSTLKTYEVDHNVVKDYKCKTFQKTFSHDITLKIHEVTHNALHFRVIQTRKQSKFEIRYGIISY